MCGLCKSLEGLGACKLQRGEAKFKASAQAHTCKHTNKQTHAHNTQRRKRSANLPRQSRPRWPARKPPSGRKTWSTKAKRNKTEEEEEEEGETKSGREENSGLNARVRCCVVVLTRLFLA